MLFFDAGRSLGTWTAVSAWNSEKDRPPRACRPPQPATCNRQSASAGFRAQGDGRAAAAAAASNKVYVGFKRGTNNHVSCRAGKRKSAEPPDSATARALNFDVPMCSLWWQRWHLGRPREALQAVATAYRCGPPTGLPHTKPPCASPMQLAHGLPVGPALASRSTSLEPRRSTLLDRSKEMLCSLHYEVGVARTSHDRWT